MITANGLIQLGFEVTTDFTLQNDGDGVYIKEWLSDKPKPTTAKVALKGPIKISKTYVPKDTEKYMCEKHKVYFSMRLTEWKKELIKANNEALYNGSMDDNNISADIVE